MKLYTCDNCANLLYFENSTCLKCGFTVGFESDKLDLLSLIPVNNGAYASVSNPNMHYKFCANAGHGTCNWLISYYSTSNFCKACVLNRTIPVLIDNNLVRWKRIEVAKHRLIYSLIRLNLPVQPKIENQNEGIAFDFIADVSPSKRVMTGHDNGVITLNIEEADEAERARNKQDLGEKYRTLLGHFRHEIGHYYWDLLISNNDNLLQDFRKHFGNETADYTEALKKYYSHGTPTNWSDNFISPYATSHPWEGWAESWSHYMHMMDTLETAYNFGLNIHPTINADNKNISVNVGIDPYIVSDFNEVVKMWLPLTFAVNSLNRSMGHPDFYPFVISDQVIEKLTFIHHVCQSLSVVTNKFVQE